MNHPDAELSATTDLSPAIRYWDIGEGRMYSAEDACCYDDWRDDTEDAMFAVHAGGFPVFLRPSEIARSDEYLTGDPYGVIGEAGEPTAFHQRRIDCMLRLLEQAVEQSTKRIRILDIACGDGHITAEILKRFPDARISALDCSLTAITKATTQYPGIDFLVADAYAPPFAEAEFDVVVLNNIWEHVPDPMRLLAAADRVLKPNGTVIISTPSRYRLGNLVRVLAGRPVQFISKHHVTEYTVGQVLEQLRFGGFEAKVFDFPGSLRASTLSSRVIRSTLDPLLRLYCKATGSHHSLEWSIFYSAHRSTR